MEKLNTAIPQEEQSYFDGGYWAYIGYSILVGFISIITLGIALPWMLCLFQRWKAKHTVVCGKRMYFDGTGLQLIGNYLLWGFLSVITLGIYSLWFSINLQKWVTKYTHYEGETDNNSFFDGGVLGPDRHQAALCPGHLGPCCGSGLVQHHPAAVADPSYCD